MPLRKTLAVIILLLLSGVIPVWPHSRGWDGPVVAQGRFLVILLILAFMGRI